MPVEISDKRTNPRSQFFLLQAGGEPISFYSFRPEEAIDAIPGLVVDLSDGGLQILTSNAQALAQASYQLELVTSEPVGNGKQYKVRAVWSRPDGINLRTGFAFDGGTALTKEIGALLSERERNVLRCVLYPS
jgi:hypothetical protein